MGDNTALEVQAREARELAVIWIERTMPVLMESTEKLTSKGVLGMTLTHWRHPERDHVVLPSDIDPIQGAITAIHELGHVRSYVSNPYRWNTMQRQELLSRLGLCETPVKLLLDEEVRAETFTLAFCREAAPLLLVDALYSAERNLWATYKKFGRRLGSRDETYAGLLQNALELRFRPRWSIIT